MGYHFVTLTEDQKHERRQLLDWHASVAQVSVLVPIIIVQVYFFTSWLVRRWRRHAQLEPPGSPYLKEVRLGSSDIDSKALRLTFTKVAWWCGESVDVFGDICRKGELVLAAGWLGWLLLLCFLRTGEDYLHLTKRFGIVAASQLPFHYLLALKSPYSPLQVLSRSSHETLNRLHQLLGHVVIILLYGHAVLYINFYILSGLLTAKVQEAYVICGIVGILAFTAVGTTALSPIRKWSYRVFYITHVTLATALLPVLSFHVTHIRIFLYETAVVYALNAVLRGLSSRTMTGTIKTVPNTSLVEIDIRLSKSGSTFGGWQAGQHAYISLPGHPLLRTFRSNPFTVASLPSVDGNLRFIARVLDGNTAKLAENASNGDVKLTVEGPYGVATHGERLLGYDRVLLMAGGVGATFVVPLYRQLLADLSPSRASYRRQKVNFLWIARSTAEVAWALPEDAKEREGFVERLKVCLTGAVGPFPNGTYNKHSVAAVDGEEGIELEEQKQLLRDASVDDEDQTTDSLTTQPGRPNLARVVDETFSHGNRESVAVVVCGPRALSSSLRKEVGRFVRKGKEVWFWEESFAF